METQHRLKVGRQTVSRWDRLLAKEWEPLTGEGEWSDNRAVSAPMVQLCQGG